VLLLTEPAMKVKVEGLMKVINFNLRLLSFNFGFGPKAKLLQTID